MPVTVLSHTADTGIEVTADSFSELLEELAAAMFGLVVDLDRCTPGRWVELALFSDTIEDLVVDSLSELLTSAEIEDVVYCRFEAAADESRCEARLRAGGAPTADVEIVGPPIKAVTYHDLVVEQRPHGWFARVYFDV